MAARAQPVAVKAGDREPIEAGASCVPALAIRARTDEFLTFAKISLRCAEVSVSLHVLAGHRQTGMVGKQH